MRQASKAIQAGSSPLSRGILLLSELTHSENRIIPALAGNTRVKQFRSWRGRGSSPLSRGIPHIAPQATAFHRIIPALAGNTQPLRRGMNTMRDHPRSRGEYCFIGINYEARVGSSPLSRGILVGCPVVHPNIRIIPALAGNTSLPIVSDSYTADHPRSRGEYAAAGLYDLTRPDHPRSRGEYGLDLGSDLVEYGSSPLSRGILAAPFCHQSRYRIIPALAGNTSARFFVARSRPDHPRSRGEYLVNKARDVIGKGSSPLSRGIRGLVIQSLLSGRIIPALAGNTFHVAPIYLLWQDHPRSRGEYSGEPKHTLNAKGSSPLSRGILETTTDPEDCRGIIPALAGNTYGCYLVPGLGRDHPRSRGEYLWANLRNGRRQGSSPLSRGILPQ